MTSSSRGCKRPPSPSSAPQAARDWAALPQDILFAVFLKIGPREIFWGADGVCKAWRRVTVGEPLLWRRLDLGTVPLRWWRWRDALRRGAGRCESFEAWGCDDATLVYLVERAPSLKKLHLLECNASFVVVNVVIKKLPLLEDLVIELSNFDTSYKKLIGSVSEACPHLKKLSLRLLEPYNYRLFDSREDREIPGGAKCVIPVMCQLHTLELTDFEFTVEKLALIIHNCPVLESLHITNCCDRRMIVELQDKCRVKNLTVTHSNEGC